MSQTGIDYPQSTLSRGKAGNIQGGDRLPWTGDNFESLKTLDWQIHVYSNATARLKECCKAYRVTWHEFPWTKAAADVGFKKDAVYVIRPDGYVALAQQQFDTIAIKDYAKLFLRLGFVKMVLN